MKFAPLLAGSAIALTLFTLASAKAINPPRKTVALDISGIDTLEVHVDLNVEVQVDSRARPELSFPDLTDSKVKVRRVGSRLVVEGETVGYGQLNVYVPPSVHHFVIDDGTINAQQPMESAELDTKAGIAWSGDVKQLVIRDIRGPEELRKPKQGECGCESGSHTLRVEKGEIVELRVYSTVDDLGLGDPDDVGVVYAWLGPKSGVSLSGARRFDHVHLMNAETAPAAP
jgi:hypothetical protein